MAQTFGSHDGRRHAKSCENIAGRRKRRAGRRKCDAAFQKQTTDLVNDGRASHSPTFADSMHSLQIQLSFRLQRHEAHARALYGLSDRFRINVVALVGFHTPFWIRRPTANGGSVRWDVMPYRQLFARIRSVKTGHYAGVPGESFLSNRD